MLFLGTTTWRQGTHHEELTEGDVRKDVVGLVLATGHPALLPEVRELVLQRSAGSQVEDVLPGQRVVQEWIVNVGEQPGGIGITFHTQSFL